jgi:hypothetical protein
VADRHLGEVLSGARIVAGDRPDDWVSLTPNVSVRQHGNAKLIELTGVFMLEGSGPATYYLRKLA